MVEKLELTLFGNLEIRQGGVQVAELKSVKAQALLCYLALTGQPHTRPVLAGLLWGEMPEANARMNLSQALTSLRRVLGDHLDITRQTVAFHWSNDIWIDVQAFETGFSEGDVESLDQAVRLYRGDFLAGFYVRRAPEFEAWVLVERARLREMALRALKSLAEYHAVQGEAGRKAAIDHLRHLLRVEPWHEEAHRDLMGLLALSGQRSAALRQYALCRQVLVEELGVEPGEDTTALYSQIQQDAFAAPGRRSPATKPQIVGFEGQPPPENETRGYLINLPAQLTRFVGRERELKTLSELILHQKKRLVTVVGLGGIGKTRLVQAFADGLAQPEVPGELASCAAQGYFPDGIVMVPLASLDTRDLILPAIADALRFRLDRGPSQLLGYLRTKQLLLILDNYEHLLDGVNILSDLQTSAPGVTALVTSREPLRLHGEQLFPLEGLDFPTVGAVQSAPDSSAGRLFLQAARRHQPDFAMEGAELGHLARICQLVEGMPLALELAASWTSSLPLSRIAAEIQKNYDFLATGLRDLPDRHRSVRATVAISWEQLTPSQKKIFAGLTVFRGGFTREAGKKITGASLRELASLVEKSFLRYVKSQDRYFMHELLRQFGNEKLAGNPEELEGIKQHHSQYFCQWAWNQLRPAHFLAVGQNDALDGMTLELENVRAAWKWALENRKFDCVWNKASVLGRYYIWRGGYQEGRRTLGAFADLLEVDVDPSHAKMIYLQATILDWQAFFLYELGEQSKALEYLQHSQSLLNSSQLTPIDARRERAHNLVIMARTDSSRSDKERNNFLAEARDLYREIKDPFGLPFALGFSGRLAILSGRYREAQQFIEESLKIYKESGNQIGRTISLTGLGNLAFVENDYARAVSILQQSLNLARQVGSRERIVIARMYQGIAYLHSGRYDKALSNFERCLADSTDQGFYRYQATSLYHLGYTHLHLGAYDPAIGYGNEALNLTEHKGDVTGQYQARILLAAVALARGSYQEALTAFEHATKERDIGWSDKFMFGEDPGMVGLGTALLRTGEIERAGRVYTSLLERAINTHRQDRLLYALAGWALFHATTGAADQAIKIYSLAYRYPVVRKSRWMADTFGRHIYEAAGALPAHPTEELETQSEDQDLWELAEKLLIAAKEKPAHSGKT